MKTYLFLTFLFGFTSISFSQKTNKIQLTDWKIQNSTITGTNGKAISANDHDDKTWIRSSVPSTIFNALVQDGKYKDIYKGKNLEKISSDPFKNSWWYRTSFEIKNLDQIYLLDFEGINYSANIWLNGKQIASKFKVINPFRQFKYQINKYILKGKNTLAIEVFPPKSGDFTIGFVDWNPAPPDNNMGIYRNVNLITNKGVEIENPYMESSFKKDNFKEADLIFSTNLKSFTKDISGVLQIEFNGSTIQKPVKLKAGENKKIILNSKDFKQLIVKNPKLWWPHTIGTPNLYRAKVKFIANNTTYDSNNFEFGIRQVSDYFTKDGHRGFKINGKKISIRGGGWVDNMTLDDTHDYILSQLEYVKDMNLNTVRLEGFWVRIIPFTNCAINLAYWSWLDGVAIGNGKITWANPLMKLMAESLPLKTLN